jgi:hypothetical protein
VSYFSNVARPAGSLGIAFMLGVTPVYAGKAPGSWAVYQDKVSVDINMSETLLADGTVLMAGGGDSDPTSTAAQIFTPSSNTWTVVAPMHKSRDQHTGTLLPDGTVLAAGGTSEGTTASPVARAETYNPATGAWKLAGAMVEPRFGQQALLLKTGKVLLCGGTQNVDTNLSSCELYNPATRSFALTGDMGVQRRAFAMVMLANGDVMADGEGGSPGIYSAANGTWRSTAASPFTNFGSTLTLLANGTVMETPSLVSGQQQTQVYDPKTNTWKLVGKELGRIYNATVTLQNGLVLTTGGCIFQCSQQNVATAQLFHADTGRWTVAPSMNVGREFHSAVTLPDGRVLVVGGGGPPEIYTY